MVALTSLLYQEIRLVTWSQCVKKKSQDFSRYLDTYFWTSVLSEFPKNIMKLLSSRFQQCFQPFNMLTVLGCTKPWLFRDLHKHFFRRLYFRKYISYDAQLFLLSVWNSVKTSEKAFNFLNNCIWIGCVKFSSLPRKSTSHRESLC